MVVSGLRYFNIPIHEIERLTLNEYYTMMEAVELKMLDRRADMAMQAWFNQGVKATKKSGKSQYNKFTDFFDAEAAEKKIITKYEGKSTSTSASSNTDVRRKLAKYYKEGLG